MSILQLPRELLAHTLHYLTYIDLVSFSATCHDAHSFVSPTNQLLWQAAFLQRFDDPRDRWNCLTKSVRQANLEREQAWDWFVELKKRAVALRWVDADDYAGGSWDGQSQEDSETLRVLETLLEIVDTAKICPTPEEVRAGKRAEVDDRELSKNLALLPTNYDFTTEFDGLVRGLPASVVKKNTGYRYGVSDAAVSMPGGWHSPGRPNTRSQATVQWDKLVRSEAGSRLHVLCGLTQREEKDEKALARARRVTYDWELTEPRNEWGPLKVDGSGEVDWRRLESICVVVVRQFTMAIRGRMTLPQGFCFSFPYRTLSDPTQPEDWARAQGTWMGTYVFMHWEGLVEFNTFRAASNRPTLEDGPESCGGLMKLELQLNMALKDDPKLHTNLPICEDLPPLYFSGISRSCDFQMATFIRGMACLAPGGKEVRWRYIVR